jgi:hypothetical protein
MSGPTNFLSVPYFDTLVANLSNLRELYLGDYCTIYSPAEDRFKALEKSGFLAWRIAASKVILTALSQG